MNKDKYSILFESSAESILFIAPEGQIYDANPEASKMFGYSIEELKRLNWVKIFIDQDTQIPAILSTIEHNKEYRKELILIRKDHSEFSAKIRIFTFENDGKKPIYGIYKRYY